MIFVTDFRNMRNSEMLFWAGSWVLWWVLLAVRNDMRPQYVSNSMWVLADEVGTHWGITTKLTSIRLRAQVHGGICLGVTYSHGQPHYILLSTCFMCANMNRWVIVGRSSAFIHTEQHSYPAQQHEIVQSHLLWRSQLPYCSRVYTTVFLIAILVAIL